MKVIENIGPIAEQALGINTPKALAKYLNSLISRQPESNVAKAWRALNAEWLQAIDRLIGKCSRILQVPPNEVLRGADFHPNDITVPRLDAIFAELRTVVFLSNEGHEDIKLIRAKGKPSPDGNSKRMGTQFVWEVQCITENNTLKKKHDPPLMDNVNIFLDRRIWTVFQEKKQQLQVESEGHPSSHRILIFVINDHLCYGTFSRERFIQTLKTAHSKLRLPTSVHLAVVTGMYSLTEGVIDDCVFPHWPNSE